MLLAIDSGNTNIVFAVYDGVATRPAHWLKGIIFGVFTWLMMMVAFMPMAGAGFFGAKIGITALVGLAVTFLLVGITGNCAEKVLLLCFQINHVVGQDVFIQHERWLCEHADGLVDKTQLTGWKSLHHKPEQLIG